MKTGKSCDFRFYISTFKPIKEDDVLKCVFKTVVSKQPVFTTMPLGQGWAIIFYKGPLQKLELCWGAESKIS